ncbi:Protein CBG01178 [Caenorhabditis briggsae]|uniref:Protein CBG01178 n=1 Tax=Caenorhabditis briggsae TaxID=6238 RepID=A8WPR9_CAEBR|nr:Protein CBG01178 [Caenorhabditis briggsae]CAP22476.2 Protein CBG01178 [Caenorhabditis briggsae]
MRPKLISISIVFSFLVPIVQSQQEQACDLNCHFEESYLSSETLKKWPKTCKIVCGNLIINEKSDLTDYEWTVNFWKLEELKGFLRVQNSSLTSLNFLENLRRSQCEGGEFGEFVVADNPNLTDIERLRLFRNSDGCTWRIVRNPRLDTTSYEFLIWINLENYGNLKDYGAGCSNVRITSESLPYYSNCTSINDGYEGKAVKISKISSSMNLTGFLKLRKIAGGIEVSNTDLEDLSFMKNLKVLDVSGGIMGGATIELQNSPNLKRLGWDSITILPTTLSLNFTNNHPEFCLTMEEAQKFAKVGPYFPNDDKILLCPNLTRADGQKVCKFDGFGNFETGCRQVVGDVIVDEDNEKDVWMLENVTHIYGSLIIRDTRELVNLNFLSSLRSVMRLTKDEDQIIRILSNKKLEKVIFPKMKTKPFPFGDDNFIDIDGNSLEIFKVQKECMLIRAMTKAKVKYNGKSCNEFVISNNSELAQYKTLSELYSEVECVWHISNNPKMNLNNFCTDTFSEMYKANLKYYGNMGGCECVNVYITPESLPYYTNCTHITGGDQGVLKIANLTDSLNLSGLLSLKKVEGNIEIFENQVSNLSFLSNLENVSKDYLSIYNLTHIHNNPDLKRLGWDSIKFQDYQKFDAFQKMVSKFDIYTVSIHDNHPDFCLTTRELQTFAENDVYVYNLEAKLCADLERKDGEKICNFVDLTSLDLKCQHLIGEVNINNENEDYSWKLENITNIYGSIVVQYTEKLTDLNFLRNLRAVASLNFGNILREIVISEKKEFPDGPPSIQINHNRMLQTVTLPNMKVPPFPKFKSGVIEINGNSMEIFKYLKDCLLFQTQTKSSVKYNGKSCKKLPVAPGKQPVKDTDYEDEYEVEPSGNLSYSASLIISLLMILVAL